MADNDDVEESENIPALFAEITALLEGAHEIAVRGQNSKLGRPDHLCLTDQLNQLLGTVHSPLQAILARLE